MRTLPRSASALFLGCGKNSSVLPNIYESAARVKREVVGIEGLASHRGLLADAPLSGPAFKSVRSCCAQKAALGRKHLSRKDTPAQNRRPFAPTGCAPRAPARTGCWVGTMFALKGA